MVIARQAHHCDLMGTTDQPNCHLLAGQKRLRLDAHRARMEARSRVAPDQQSRNLRQVVPQRGQVCRRERSEDYCRVLV